MNSNQPKISFIVPIYNRAHFLERCINSIKNQTLTNIEIILINDGSTDNSEQISNSFVAQDSRIRYYYLEKSGVSIARNYGIRMAKGEYLGFVDSDDYIEADFAEKMYQSATQEHSLMTCCGITQINAITQNRDVCLPELLSIDKFTKQNIYVRNPIWNKIFQTKFIMTQGIAFPEGARIAEDYAFICMLILASTQSNVHISYVREPLYNYWQHENSTMSSLHVADICDNISDLMISVNALSRFILKLNNYKNANQLLKVILRDYYLTTLPFHFIHRALKAHKIDKQGIKKIYSAFMDYQAKYKCYSNAYYWIIYAKLKLSLY